MNDTWIHPYAAVETLTLRAGILYDDYSSACRAKEFLERVTARFSGAVQFSLALWQMEGLQRPTEASAALRDFGGADLLVLVLGPGNVLPRQVLDWMECWAEFRGHADSAVVVLWSSANLSSSTASNLGELRQLAQRCRFTLFQEGTVEPGRQARTCVARPASNMRP